MDARHGGRVPALGERAREITMTTDDWKKLHDEDDAKMLALAIRLAANAGGTGDHPVADVRDVRALVWAASTRAVHRACATQTKKVG